MSNIGLINAVGIRVLDKIAEMNIEERYKRRQLVCILMCVGYLSCFFHMPKWHYIRF